MANVTQAVYAAEWALRSMLDHSHEAPTVQIHGSVLTLPIERKFADLNSIQAYVDAVLQLNWIKETYPRASLPVTVRERRGQELAHYERLTATVAIPPYERGQAWAMREIVVLHELAHHLATESGHGPNFTEVFVNLVKELMGAEVGFILHSLYMEEGVSVGT